MPAVLEALKKAGMIFNGDLAIEVVGKQVRVYEVVNAYKGALRRIAYSDTFMGGRYLRFDDPAKGKSQDAKDFTVARLYGNPAKARKIIEKYFPKFVRESRYVHFYYSGRGPKGQSVGSGDKGYFTIPLGRALPVEGKDDAIETRFLTVDDLKQYANVESIDELKGIPKAKKYRVNRKSREYRMGQQAFKGGKQSAPALNQKLMQGMTDYAAGWHEANAAAPVEGIDEGLDEAKSARAKVLKKWPNAKARVHHTTKYPRGYRVTALDQDTARGVILGQGADEIRAWEDAAKKLKESLDEKRLSKVQIIKGTQGSTLMFMPVPLTPHWWTGSKWSDKKGEARYYEPAGAKTEIGNARAAAQKLVKKLKESIDEKRIFLPDVYKGPTYKVGDEVMIVRRFGWKRGYAPTAIKPPVPGKVVKRDINIFYPKGPPKLTLRIKPEDYDRASPGVVHTSANEIIVQADEVRPKKKNESIDEVRSFKPGQKVKVASLSGRIVSKVENDPDTVFDDEYVVDLGQKGKHKIKADVIRAEADRRPAVPITRVLKAIGRGARKLMSALQRKPAVAAETADTVRSIIRAVKGAGFTPKRIRLHEVSISQPPKDNIFILHRAKEDHYVVAHSVHADPKLGYQELETKLSQKEAERMVRKMRTRWKGSKVSRFTVMGQGHKREYLREARCEAIKLLVEDAVKDPANSGLTLQQILRKMFKSVDERGRFPARSRGKMIAPPGKAHRSLQKLAKEVKAARKKDDKQEVIKLTAVMGALGKLSGLNWEKYLDEACARFASDLRQICGSPTEPDATTNVDEKRKIAINLKTKEEVSYRESDGDERCGICAFVTLPDACKRVRGKIDQDFTCDLWKKGIAEGLDEVTDPLVKKLGLVVNDTGHYKGTAVLSKGMMGGTGVKVQEGRVFVEYILPDVVSLIDRRGKRDRFTRRQVQRYLTKLPEVE